jgi:hypothetical protein
MFKTISRGGGRFRLLIDTKFTNFRKGYTTIIHQHTETVRSLVLQRGRISIKIL